MCGSKIKITGGPNMGKNAVLEPYGHYKGGFWRRLCDWGILSQLSGRGIPLTYQYHKWPYLEPERHRKKKFWSAPCYVTAPPSRLTSRSSSFFSSAIVWACTSHLRARNLLSGVCQQVFLSEFWWDSSPSVPESLNFGLRWPISPLF